MQNAPRFVIFANGLVPEPEELRRLIRQADRIVCADGGTRLALLLGLKPEAVVGDLDSMAGSDRLQIEQAGIPILQHPTDKDETDLELALQYVIEKGPSAILIVGALGGRLDQTLGNLALITGPQFDRLNCSIDDGVEQVRLCRKRVEVVGAPGDLISLIPWGGPVSKVRTEGLRWALDGETLQPDKSRGISNEMLAQRAVIQCESGLLLVIHTRRS